MKKYFLFLVCAIVSMTAVAETDVRLNKVQLELVEQVISNIKLAQEMVLLEQRLNEYTKIIERQQVEMQLFIDDKKSFSATLTRLSERISEQQTLIAANMKSKAVPDKTFSDKAKGYYQSAKSSLTWGKETPARCNF